MNKLVVSLLFSLAWPVATALAEDGDAILGTWNTAANRGRVEVFKQDSKYAAKILWLREAKFPANDDQGMAGKPKVDRNNPKADLRQRSLVGLQIMEGLTYAGKKLWDHGHIYDPETGKTYKCKMTLVATNKLELRGFLGISLLGRTTVWTR